MAEADDFAINAVAYQEGEVWIAQGVEYDISAQAKSLPALWNEFHRVIIANMAVCEELGRKPLEGIGPAPAAYRRMFEEAELSVEGEAAPLRSRHPTYRPRINIKVTEKVAA